MTDMIKIRENKKACKCLRCVKIVPRGKQMLHLDVYGSKHSVCLDCTAELGWYAKEAQRREMLNEDKLRTS